MPESSANQAETPIEDDLYKKREKIYPREVHGLFAALRIAAMLGLLGLFYGLPWINIGGQQIVLFDLPARKFYVFGLTFWPQDFFLLAMILPVLGHGAGLGPLGEDGWLWLGLVTGGGMAAIWWSSERLLGRYR